MKINKLNKTLYRVATSTLFDFNAFISSRMSLSLSEQLQKSPPIKNGLSSRMEEVRIIMLCFAGSFTFAFGLGWIIPLCAACRKEKKPTRVDIAASILDLIMILLDCIPVFWIFRAIPEAPSAYRASREAWRKEPYIWAMFWLSATSLIVAVLALYIPV